MCVGGGGSTPAARITDPLQATAGYKKANARVQRIQARKGSMDPGVYQQKLKAAKSDRKAVQRKYKNDRANTVENDTTFMADAIRQLLSDGNPLNIAQDLLNQSNASVQDTLTQLNDLATMAADNQQLLQQDAMRQSLLKGAPPPEKSADRPVIGRNRDDSARPGQTRQDLRIDRTSSNGLTIY